MTQPFRPHLDILPPTQRLLWDELSVTPSDFALYGGTAIALRLGHRASVAFDFFSSTSFRPGDLMARIPYLDGATIRQSAADTLTATVDRGGPVQVSFFGGLTLGQVEPHGRAEGSDLAVASLIDLAGTKAAVVTQRAELKDYLDIHALLIDAKLPLGLMLSAASIIYDEEFNAVIALKAISYHDDPALKDLPHSIRRALVDAVSEVDPARLPPLAALRRRRGGRPGGSPS
ncbi:MAG TPA: nucleotidyl transferase AbiEii/AbiGii toxin family protein [Lichenihabitans sp.]|nr:nucleotidyl transferase AbiEii/AbiGii toxin family protein [Lichenihabitans sp.]